MKAVAFPAHGEVRTTLRVLVRHPGRGLHARGHGRPLEEDGGAAAGQGVARRGRRAAVGQQLWERVPIEVADGPKPDPPVAIHYGHAGVGSLGDLCWQGAALGEEESAAGGGRMSRGGAGLRVHGQEVRERRAEVTAGPGNSRHPPSLGGHPLQVPLPPVHGLQASWWLARLCCLSRFVPWPLATLGGLGDGRRTQPPRSLVALGCPAPTTAPPARR